MSEESPNTRISPQTQPSLHEQIADAVRTVRETTPLAQSFTNFVTINLVANAQLAAGGAAAMSFLPDDIIDTATISGADYINVGTLLPFYKDALPQVARAFHNTGHPWVLDPVGRRHWRDQNRHIAVIQALSADRDPRQRLGDRSRSTPCGG